MKIFDFSFLNYKKQRKIAINEWEDEFTFF